MHDRWRQKDEIIVRYSRMQLFVEFFAPAVILFIFPIFLGHVFIRLDGSIPPLFLIFGLLWIIPLLRTIPTVLPSFRRWKDNPDAIVLNDLGILIERISPVPILWSMIESISYKKGKRGQGEIMNVRLKETARLEPIHKQPRLLFFLPYKNRSFDVPEQGLNVDWAKLKGDISRLSQEKS